eukprot:PhF_6_TR31499/c0_g1_i1/m.46357
MIPIVKRNTSIPTKKSHLFSTHCDNQKRVQIKVFEGDRATTCDCQLLCILDLQDIPPAPRGVPDISITLDLDCECLVTVTAEVQGTDIKKVLILTNDKPVVNVVTSEEAQIECKTERPHDPRFQN